jgi:cell division inhibitor SepF
MPQMLRKAMDFLGLLPDQEYDEGVPLDEYDPPAGARPVAEEAPSGAVRALPRERAHPADPPNGGGVPRRPRPGLVRSIATDGAPAGAKPHTVAPSSFLEAQEVADRYMAGTPVILNLQGAERDLSRRLVDFASGLCYGLRGQMERVTTQVYLLTPTNVEVSAEERRRLHDRAPA